MIAKFSTPVSSSNFNSEPLGKFSETSAKISYVQFSQFLTPFVNIVFCRTLRTRNLCETDFRRNFKKFTHMSRNRKKNFKRKLEIQFRALNLRQNTVITFRTGNIRINRGPDIFEISRMNARKVVLNLN